MGKLLLAFLTVTSALVAVQTAAAMGLAGVATNLIVAEELADICLPDLKRKGRIPELEAAFVLLKSAMTKNAELLHPGQPAAKFATAVDRYVEDGRRREASAPANPQLCNEQTTGAIRAALRQASDPKFADALVKMGGTVAAYDVRVPFGGKPGAPMTYASLASQQNLLGMINDNEGGTCPAPAIDQVVLVSRAPGGALHLPPFILPPMQYTESWRVHCGAAVRQMLATFKEDSEGPAGIAMVKRQP